MRFSVDGRKRYENDKCGRKSFWKLTEQNNTVFVWKGGCSVDGV